MPLAFADGKPTRVNGTGRTLTRNILTTTLDGSATAAAFAGIAHGGPADRIVKRVYLGDQAPSATDGVVVTAIAITGADTTDEEVNVTVVLSAAGTTAEKVVTEVFMEFDEVAAVAGQSAPIAYTAPNNNLVDL